MAWVQPNTEVRLLRGIRLHRGFQHTIYWDNDEDQSNYFKNKTAYLFNPQTYQRTDRGTIRVRETYDHIMTCNYLMFRNSSHGAKWFYAFIDNAEYINENTTEIAYSIDPLQTWQFQYQLLPCFVEREHFETDNIGDSMVAEELETGDYVCAEKRNVKFSPDVSGVVGDFTLLLYYVGQDGGRLSWNEQEHKYDYVSPSDPQIPDVKQYPMYNNVPSATRLLALPFVEGPEALLDNQLMREKLWLALDALTASDSTVVNIIIIPSDMYKFAITTNQQGEVVPILKGFNEPEDFPALSLAFGTYTPKNNKLYQSPYQKITMSNNKGDTAEYKWEMFKPHPVGITEYDAVFKLTATVLPNPMCYIYPYDYKGVVEDYENGMFIPDFIPTIWSEDSYNRWWAQNKNQYNQKMIFSILDTVIGGVKMGVGLAGSAIGGKAVLSGIPTVGNFSYTYGAKTTFQSGSVLESGIHNTSSGAGEVYQGIQNISNLVSVKEDHKAYEDNIKGQVADNALKLQQEQLNFTIYMYTIGAEHAQIIDQYFSQYGYACHQVKIPNRNVRHHWCYTKTQNCIVEGNIPSDVHSEIEAIYNNGITFWLDPEHVGDYAYYLWENDVIPPENENEVTP